MKADKFVLILRARGTPENLPAAQVQQTTILGTNTAIALQAMICRKELDGDARGWVITPLNWLTSLTDVGQIIRYDLRQRSEGMVALHAAAIDPRITQVILEN